MSQSKPMGGERREGTLEGPPPHKTLFIGREAELTAIGEALHQSRTAGITQAITGLGGVGKSRTALEYAYRHRDDYAFIFWVGAESEGTLDRDYGEIARRLDLAAKEAPETEAVREGVKRWLTEHTDYLLILDDADDPPLLAPYLPPAPAGHVLVASRARDLSALRVEQPLRLAALPEDEAVEFLLTRAGRGEHPAEWAAASKLAKQLGGLPLALELAGAYIAARKIGFDEYLALCWRQRLGLLERGRPEWGAPERTVQGVWEASFDAVRAMNPAAAELLTVSAFFAPEQIPYELLLLGAPELGRPLAMALAGSNEDESGLGQLLAVLEEYSLIQSDPESKSYSVHRLVQEMIRAPRTKRGKGVGLTPADRHTGAHRAVRGLDRAFPLARPETWPLCERLLPHVLAGAGWIETEGLQSERAAYLLNRTSHYLLARGQSNAVEPLLQRAIAIGEAVLGPKHLHMAASLNNLAELYQKQGRRAAAEPLYERALAIHWQVLGPDHPHTAYSLNNLAELHREQENLAAAETLHQRALAIREQFMGPDHPDTAQSLHSLAGIYRDQGNLAAAEPLLQRALEIRERLLGPEHLDTADSLNALAGVCEGQGNLAAAEPLYQRALAICEPVLGPEHPDTVACRENSARLRAVMAEQAEAGDQGGGAADGQEAHDEPDTG
jgi:tetratricopeptide (TPR) repeat protein